MERFRQWTRGLPLALAALVPGGTVLAAQSVRAGCDPPRCFDVVVLVPPRLRVPDSTVCVLQPVGYESSSARVSYEKDFYRGGYHGWPYGERSPPGDARSGRRGVRSGSARAMAAIAVVLGQPVRPWYEIMAGPR